MLFNSQLTVWPVYLGESCSISLAMTNTVSMRTFYCIRHLLVLFLVCSEAFAGSIGFSVNFTRDEIAISNTGSDAAYHISEWTLDSANQWRKAEVIDGNDAYLAPGKTLKSRRPSLPNSDGLGKADPLLVVMHDQAGSRIAQLAWHHAPAIQPQPLLTMRNGAEVTVAADTALDQTITTTYALVVPYEGIERLAQSLSLASAPPPNLIRHTWASGQPLVVETGKGQAGVWLVHETEQGDLRLQIVPDGFLRGQEQVPAWLLWARQYMMTVAMVLAALGVLTMVVGFARRWRVPARLKWR